MGTQHEDWLIPIRPSLEAEDGLVGLSSDHERIDRGHESLVPVLLATTIGQEIQRAIRPCDEAVETGSYEHGRLERHSSSGADPAGLARSQAIVHWGATSLATENPDLTQMVTLVLGQECQGAEQSAVRTGQLLGGLGQLGGIEPLDVNGDVRRDALPVSAHLVERRKRASFIQSARLAERLRERRG